MIKRQLFCAALVWVAFAAVPPRAQTPRLTVAISDLHFGPGRDGPDWSPLEDFRWPRALEGFLDEISRRGQNRVDLIIAGDLLELWQHPPVRCNSFGAGHSCSLDEISRVVSAVVSAHARDLQLLGTFAARGENHLYIVPGNHDAALMLKPVAATVLAAIGQPSARVTLVDSGRWISSSSRIIVEHGHQIGADPNNYRSWPRVSSSIQGTEVLDSPWGESFVQLFNEVEKSEPLIDNLLPLSEGVKLYSSRRGMLGTALDTARFVGFNVFQTSIRQKLALGGEPAISDDRLVWDVGKGRNLGYRLFVNALALDDPLRVQLITDQGQNWVETRTALDNLARSETELSEVDVLALCDQIAIRNEESLEKNTDCSPLGGSIAQSVVPIDRVIEAHLKSLGGPGRAVELFVYGHTHEAHFNWSLRASGRPVTAFNTGAFQRLIDPPGLRALATQSGVNYADGMRLPLERLPACYSAVLVENVNQELHGRLLNWVMDESAASGEFVDPCDARCPTSRSAACPGSR
jgi:UDP-2,3-diacylglucosamine pyrophosphatase LpxH